MKNICLVLCAFLVTLAGQGAPAMGQSGPKKILVLGDSLAAGFGLAAGQAFPAVMQEALKARGHNLVFINAGVSGDTSAGGFARLDWALGEGAEGVIVELGANDMLRGIDPGETEKALDGILAKLAQKKLPVLLAGMIAAPGMGRLYETRFNAIYGRLAEKYGVLLYPFFLEGVANERHLLLSDGLHPNKQGVEEIVRRIFPKVLELITQVQKS